MKPVGGLHLVGLTAIVLVSTPADAWAYVDPGTGSYLFQLAVAGFLATAYTLRRQWATFKAAILARFDRARLHASAQDGD